MPMLVATVLRVRCRARRLDLRLLESVLTMNIIPQNDYDASEIEPNHAAGVIWFNTKCIEEWCGDWKEKGLGRDIGEAVCYRQDI